jgi:hypothetical protein
MYLNISVNSPKSENSSLSKLKIDFWLEELGRMVLESISTRY